MKRLSIDWGGTSIRLALHGHGCHCGKYKHSRYDGIICDKCGTAQGRLTLTIRRNDKIIYGFPGRLIARRQWRRVEAASGPRTPTLITRDMVEPRS